MKRQFQKEEAAAQKKQPGIATTKVKIHAVTLVLKVRRQKRNLQKKRRQKKRKYPPVSPRVIPVRAKTTFPFLRSTVIPPVP